MRSERIISATWVHYVTIGVTVAGLLWLAGCGSDSPSPADPGGSTGGPTPNPAGVLLEGNPNSPALLATRLLPPSPVDASLIVDGLLTIRLTAVIAGNATVGQVNQALRDNNVRIVTMFRGNLLATLKTPPLASRAESEALAQALVSTGAFVFAMPAFEQQPEPAPRAVEIPDDVEVQNRILPPGGHGDIEHLVASYFPAAWNAARLAVQNNNRVKVVVPDVYSSNTPGADINAQSFVPGIGSPYPSADETWYRGNHGYHVSGIIGANFDANGATGTNPDPTLLLDIRSLHMTGISSVDAVFQMTQGFPASGNFVVSTSLGHGGEEQLTKDDFIELAFGALAWRIHAAADQHRFFHATTAGNEAEVGGLRSLASYGSKYSVAHLWDNPRDLIPADSLSAAEWQGFDLAWNAIIAQNPIAVGAMTNTLVVGSSEPYGNESSFSNTGSEVRAVGERVLAPCALQDPSYPADPDACNGTVARYTGTSMAAPIVAGLAAYIWNLDPSLTPQQLAQKIQYGYDASRNTGVVDAYVAVLSVDNSISDAPVRRTLLDVAGASVDTGPNGVFDEFDIEAFLIWFEHYELDRNINGHTADYSRYDLSGEGFTGGTYFDEFDLNVNQIIFGNATQNVCDGVKSFDEGTVIDLEILTYYAYSPLYQGDANRRDELLCEGPFVEINGLPQRVSPGQPVTVTARAGTATNGDSLYLEGVSVEVRAYNGTQGPVTGVTDSNGEFVVTVTMRDETFGEYFNDLTVHAIATIGGEQVTAEATAIRPNAIVLRSRTVTFDVYAYFNYDDSPAPGSEILINASVDTTLSLSTITTFVDETFAFDESAVGAGMSVRTKISQHHQAQIFGSEQNFSGATFTGTTSGFVQLSNPNFDLRSYNARADGRTDSNISFAVYGDPATFTMSGSVSAARVYFVWLFGPGTTPFECQYNDGCNSVSGGGTLTPAVYSFVAAERDFGVISWCPDCENTVASGTQDASGSLTATLSVGH